MMLGIDRLLSEPSLQRRLHGLRVALLAHPASVTAELEHSLDALFAHTPLGVASAFGPQHGLRGDKQDNMIESRDEIDPLHGIPVFSLYGTTRRLTAEMLGTFDVCVVDLQDVGCRIYTFLTTLCYVLEDCAAAGKSVWVLDRPNPAGRPVEGLALRAGFESFVGVAAIPMRHGLTLGEAARWYREHRALDLDLEVIPMEGYDPNSAPGYGWCPTLTWVNPSPNLATLNAARCYAGTVLLEGTTLSEGRGTTRPLEVLGAPQLDVLQLLATMRELAAAWMDGCRLRPCYFEPTFHKHVGTRCAGLQIHTDHASYQHSVFKPFRLIALLLKALRKLHTGYTLWRDFPYEYVTGRLPIDTIAGSALLREWVDDSHATPADLEALLRTDEQQWCEQRRPWLLY